MSEGFYFRSGIAMGRIGGWSAHVMEQHADNRLIRPRARYVGSMDMTWVSIGDR